MKQLIKTGLKELTFLVLLSLSQVIVFAQDSTGNPSQSSTTTTTTHTTVQTDNWYTQPWVWIVGGAVLILIVVAAVRSSNSSKASSTDRVTVTKTVRTDSDRG